MANTYTYASDGAGGSKLTAFTYVDDPIVIVPDTESGLNVTAIEASVFAGATSITDVTIGIYVTSIGASAFSGCTGTTGSLIFNSGTAPTIGADAFLSCAFTNLTVGETDTGEVGGWYTRTYFQSFAGTLTIGSGVTSIGVAAFYDCTGFTGNITIPDSVTSIGGDAFSGCNGFTDLTIGISVTSIGDYAFYNCSGTTGSLVFNSGTAPTIGGTNAFFNCVFSNLTVGANETGSVGGWYAAGTYFQSFAGTLTIGSGVTSIGVAAFSDNATLGCVFTGTLSIPNSVTTIGDNAFVGCSSFTGTLTIGNSVTSIGDGAFSYYAIAYGFTGTLTIPDSVTTIGAYAFYDCTGFTGDLTIPNSVTSIGDYAFYNCTGFTGSLIFNSGTAPTIGADAFLSCSFSNLTVGATSTGAVGGWYAAGAFINTLTCGLTIGSGVTSIAVSAFGSYNLNVGCTFTGSLIIPDSVTTISNEAFSYCTGFTDLTIGSSVTSIGNYAFAYCSGFTGDLYIPNSVTTIGGYAFYGCAGFLGSLTLSSNAAFLPIRTFSGCTGFTGNLTIPTSVISIGEDAFDSCSGLTGSLIFEKGTAPSIASDAFVSCAFTNLHVGSLSTGTIYGWSAAGTVIKNLTCSLTIGSNATTIGVKAFYLCSFTGNLNLPLTLTTINSEAFDGCSGLTGTLSIPDGVTFIDNEAFNVCTGFTSLNLNNVTSIGAGTFQGCTGLTILNLPSTVTELYNLAFLGCDNLTRINCFGNAPTVFINSLPAKNLYRYSTATGYGATLSNATVNSVENFTFVWQGIYSSEFTNKNNYNYLVLPLPIDILQINASNVTSYPTTGTISANLVIEAGSATTIGTSCDLSNCPTITYNSKVFNKETGMNNKPILGMI